MSDPDRHHIRALGRAITILRVLNQHNGLNASELSRLIDLPRPTVLRLLTTLSDNGYVVRCDADTTFRASRKVRELSQGYVHPLRDVASDFLAELEHDLVWPLAVVRLDGDALMVEALTDHSSRAVLRRDSAGRDLPLLASASGYLFLAEVDEAQRNRMLERAWTADEHLLKAAGISELDVFDRIERARHTDHALLHMPKYSSLSVAVRVDGQLRCALNLRMHASAEARRQRLESFIPDLRRGASELARRIAGS